MHLRRSTPPVSFFLGGARALLSAERFLPQLSIFYEIWQIINTMAIFSRVFMSYNEIYHSRIFYLPTCQV